MKFISPGGWFSLEYPATWSEFEDSEGDDEEEEGRGETPIYPARTENDEFENEEDQIDVDDS